ncbi:MAG TPA: lysophospholipid acyltransferase family protein [Verrucomicrobiota bacterium]|nr:lysophospholipid acyltransferase family protein [Verrucomicrobiota bacterium]HNU51129.1 lysophospholipid acyltransferase family protein [Verrucomicrobiota bacterium]
MNLPYLVTWVLCRSVFCTAFRLRVCNAERVPATGPVILAANHASYFDPPLIGASLRRPLHYLARNSLFRHPASNWLLRSINCVPVDREGGGAAGLKAIFERLQAGAAILLFPEGTRTPDGTLHRARAGVGLAIIKSTCSVIPVRVFGTYEAYGRHHRVPRPRPLVVKFGPPVDVARLRTEAGACSRERLKAVYQEASDLTMDAVGRLEPVADVTAFPTRRP